MFAQKNERWGVFAKFSAVIFDHYKSTIFQFKFFVFSFNAFGSNMVKQYDKAIR